MKPILFSVLILAGTGCATAAESPAANLRDRAMAGDNVAYETVRELTTLIGPRPAGSDAERAAAEWAAAKFRSYGFDNVRIETFPLTAWVRGEEHAEIIAPKPQPMVAVALGGSPGTPPEGVEGEVVLFESLDAMLKAAPHTLDGKIPMINLRMQRTRDGSGYATVLKGRDKGPAEAASRGATAFMVRSAGTDGQRLPHAGYTRYLGETVAIPSFSLSGPDADQIERLIGMGVKVRVRLRSGARYIRGAHSQNVIAEIKGRGRPDEVILLGAHLDSWDQGTGAIDDGAGVAIVTAAAKLIGDLPRHPKRTIRVVLYGSEEVSQPNDGGTGGEAYQAAYAKAIGKHRLAMESDFGTGPIYAVALSPGMAESTFGDAAMRVLSPIGIERWPEPAKRGGSDIQPLVEAGVPTIALRQDGTNYFDIHHTPDDTLDKIDRKALDQNVAAWSVIAWMAADTDLDFHQVATAKPR
jgi:carboxypeptidase Q